MAWHDLQFINVLSPNFPARVSATMSESVKDQIVDEFLEVFRDTLTEEPMRVPEMRLPCLHNKDTSRLSWNVSLYILQFQNARFISRDLNLSPSPQIIDLLRGCSSKTYFLYIEIPNPRLQRIREKLAEFNMIVKWVPGKSQHIADALSRAPLFSGPEEEEELSINTARTFLTQVVEKNPELRMILDGLNSDYTQFRRDILADICVSTYSHQMKSVCGQLSVDEELVYVDGSRIMLPNKSIKSVLSLLHSSHAGIDKTYDIARQLYFWPGILNDIKQLIEKCQACRIHKPSLPKNPHSTAPPSSYMGPPMAHVRNYLFHFGGGKYLVCVDQWSGYPLYRKL